MGVFFQGFSAVVPRLNVVVVLNGSVRSDIYCTRVELGHGTSGSTASFVAPGADWDGGKNFLRGAFVQVFVSYAGGFQVQLFNGYVHSASGSTDGRVIEFSARSLIALSDNVYLGQGDAERNSLVVEYPREAMKGGTLTETGWSVKEVLRDIFVPQAASWRGGGGSIPSSWRARLQLGPLSVLSSSYNDVTLGDVVFRQATLRDALDQLLGIVGTVSFREVFVGVRTRLEFFELGDPSAPTRVVRVARPGQSVMGTNVLTISHEEGAEDVKTRVICLGDRRKFVVSVTTEHATAPLERMWEEALEGLVLANPEAGKRAEGQRGEFEEALAHVFRRFRLPECIRRMVIEQNNAVDLSSGEAVPVQVWKYPRTLSYDSGSGEWISVESDVPVLLEGTQLDPATGVVTLREPAINLSTSLVDGNGNPVDTYLPAVVGVTLTVAGARIAHDTGVRRNGLRFEGINVDGLTETFLNESFGYRQMTNEGFAFRDGAGDEHVFGETWLLVGDEWQVWESAEVMQDDERPLRVFTDNALREKNSVKTNYGATAPWWTSGYAMGERIMVIGQNDHEYGTHQILSIAHDLGHDHQTSIATDSSVPLVANQILGGGG